MMLDYDVQFIIRDGYVGLHLFPYLHELFLLVLLHAHCLNLPLFLSIRKCAAEYTHDHLF